MDYKNISIVEAKQIAPKSTVSIQDCGIGVMTVIQMANGFKVTINSDGQVATWENNKIKDVIAINNQCDGIIETNTIADQKKIIKAMVKFSNSKASTNKFNQVNYIKSMMPMIREDRPANTPEEKALVRNIIEKNIGTDWLDADDKSIIKEAKQLNMFE